MEGEASFSSLKDVDLIILSPGVNARTPRFQALRDSGIILISEIEFAYHFSPGNIIAVTGTNGKSTTVSLIHHILDQAGKDNVLAGNIGNPLIAELDNLNRDTVIVLEVSSFQLEEIVHFKPHIAVLLNISPDHLDRYSDLNDYIAAKLSISKNQNPGDFVILNHDDPILERGVGTKARQIWFSTRQSLNPGCYLKDARVIENWDSFREKISIEMSPLKGLHNRENMLAAITAVRIAGVNGKQVESALGSFRGLPHRIESLGSINGIEFINDSKATNIDASLKSLSSFNSGVVLILGGKDKGSDFSLLADAIEKRTRRVLLIGEAAEIIQRQLSPLTDKLERVKDMREAVVKGYRILKEKGGTVLLSPGCASFDMFDNFRHRGDVFKQEFAALKKEIQNG
jgi:UDP-N-acetylmuramoylalanine--D-glutamate ligase